MSRSGNNPPAPNGPKPEPPPNPPATDYRERYYAAMSLAGQWAQLAATNDLRATAAEAVADRRLGLLRRIDTEHAYVSPRTCEAIQNELTQAADTKGGT